MFNIDRSDTPSDIVQAIKAAIFCQLRRNLCCCSALATSLQRTDTPIFGAESKRKFHQRPFVSRRLPARQPKYPANMKRFEEGLSRAQPSVMAPVVRDLEQSWLQEFKTDRNSRFLLCCHWMTFEVALNRRMEATTFPHCCRIFLPPRLITSGSKFDPLTTRSTLCCWENSTHRLQRFQGFQGPIKQDGASLGFLTRRTHGFVAPMHTNLCNL